MKHKSWIAALAALVVVALALFLRPDPEESAPRPRLEDNEVSQARAVPETAALAAQENSTADGRQAIQEPRAPTGPRLHGRVVLDPRAPADEALHVLPGRGPGRPIPVAADGTFDAPWPEGVDDMKLRLSARYHYLPDPVPLTDPGKEVRLEPILGGRLLARVTTPGRADEALTVEVVEVDHYSPGRFSSRELEAGLYETLALPTGQIFRVQVASPEFVDTNSEGVTLLPGQTAEVTVDLIQGARLAGQAVDDTGQPVEGAAVAATSRLGEGNLAVRQDTVKDVTDDEGRFELRGLPPGVIDLRADMDGYLPVRETLGRVADGNVRADLSLVLGQGGSLSGIVRWPDGTPAHGAEVRALGERGGRQGLAEDTGTDGTFTFEGLTAESYQLIAAATDAGGEAFVGGLEAIATGSQGIELVLGAGDSIEGRVVDDTGTPVEDFKVALLAVDGSPGVGGTASPPVEQEEGRFTVSGLTAGRWSITVTGPGGAGSRPTLVEVPHSTGALEFVCPRLASLTGRVVDPSGTPVEGATVLASVPGQRATGKSTDEEGTFTFPSLRPGPVELLARADGFAASEATWVQLDPGSNLEEIELDVHGGASLTGEVHDAVWSEGARKVLLSPADDYQFIEATVDANGHFTASGLEAGPYRVCLDWRGTDDWVAAYSTRHEEIVEVTLAHPPHVILGAPSAEDILVTGTVTNRGVAVDGFVVYIFFPNGPSNQPVTITRTDENGRFEAQLGWPGPYQFSIGETQTRQTIFERDVPAEPEVLYDFEMPTGVIRGVLRDPDGRPMNRRGLILSLESAAQDTRSFGEMRTASTDDDGRFEFDNLAGTTYRIRVGGTGPSTSGEPSAVKVVTGVELEEGGDVELDIELEHECFLQGRVVDASGSPTPGATIGARDANGQELTIWNHVQADHAGEFLLSRLSAGSWTLWATAPDGREGTTEVEVLEGAPGEVVVRVQ